MSSITRTTLGPNMNLVCFQYLRIITEEVAGRAPIIAAGRKRGYDLAESLGLLGATSDATTIKNHLAAALGAEGTRLCLVESITSKDNGGFEVHIAESACIAGQHSNEPLCAFTLGVFVGAIHAITGTRMMGSESACSACGVPVCIYQVDPI